MLQSRDAESDIYRPVATLNGGFRVPAQIAPRPKVTLHISADSPSNARIAHVISIDTRSTVRFTKGAIPLFRLTFLTALITVALAATHVTPLYVALVVWGITAAYLSIARAELVVLSQLLDLVGHL